MRHCQIDLLRAIGCDAVPVDPNDDLPRFSDADRRTLRWIAAAVLAALVGFATARWTLGVVERLGLVTGIAALVATIFVIVATRRRRGRGWTAVRFAAVIAAAVVIGTASVVGLCIPAGCFN